MFYFGPQEVGFLIWGGVGPNKESGEKLSAATEPLNLSLLRVVLNQQSDPAWAAPRGLSLVPPSQGRLGGHSHTPKATSRPGGA